MACCCRPQQNEIQRKTLNSISLTVNLQNRPNQTSSGDEEEKYLSQLLSDYILNISVEDEKCIDNDYKTIHTKLTTSSWFLTKIIVNQSVKTLPVPLNNISLESANFFAENLTKLKVGQKDTDIIRQAISEQIEIFGEMAKDSQDTAESFSNLSNTFYCHLNDEYGQISYIGLLIYGFVPLTKTTSKSDKVTLICCGHCEEWQPSNLFNSLQISNKESKQIKNYLIYQLLQNTGDINEEVRLPVTMQLDALLEQFHNKMNRKDILSVLGLQSSPIYNVDSDGYLQFERGLLIDKRFVLVGVLGKGAFSKVFEALNISTTPATKCAIKIIRNIEPFIAASKLELNILRQIGTNSLCIHLQHDFVWKKHPCFVFPKCGPSILNLMCQNKYKPFPLDIIHSLTDQICNVIQFIHSIGVIYTDLKPENIIFTNGNTYYDKDKEILIPLNSKIKLIDYGSTVYERARNKNKNKCNNHLIQTRHYRAPEVVLGMAWNKSVDIWSIGTLILELVYGHMVFITHCPIDHLNQMQQMIGPIPSDLKRSASHKKFNLLFEKDLTLKIKNANKSRIQSKLLDHYFKLNNLDHVHLFSLIKKCLRWKANERIKSYQFDKHKYFEFIKNILTRTHGQNDHNNDIVLSPTTANK